jgi:hypothetical protein
MFSIISNLFKKSNDANNNTNDDHDSSSNGSNGTSDESNLSNIDTKNELESSSNDKQNSNSPDNISAKSDIKNPGDWDDFTDPCPRRIGYVRVSSNEHMAFMNEQYKFMQLFSNLDNDIFQELGTVKNGITDMLMDTLTNIYHQEYDNKVHLYVYSVDRIAHSIDEIKKLSSMVSSINIFRPFDEDRNIQLDIDNSIRIDINNIDEIEKYLKLDRIESTNKHKQNGKKNKGQKANARIDDISKVMSNSKIPVKDLSRIVHLSQCLSTKDEWEILSCLSTTHGGHCIMDDYEKNVEQTENHANTVIIKLSREDIIGYISEICNKYSKNISTSIIREFVNAELFQIRINETNLAKIN